MPPPPSADGCCALAVVYALLASGVCWIAIRRRRSVRNADRFIAWIPASSCVGSIAAILAGPVALGEEAMERIGYIVEFAFMRSFLGAATTAFVASVILHIIKTRFQNGRSSTVAIAFATVVCGTAFVLISIRSTYVGFFVVIHVVTLVAANIVYIRRYIQRPTGPDTFGSDLSTTTEPALPER